MGECNLNHKIPRRFRTFEYGEIWICLNCEKQIKGKLKVPQEEVEQLLEKRSDWLKKLKKRNRRAICPR